MDRKTFFDLMVAAKEASGKSTNTVSFDLRMQWSTLRRFEKGTNNSNMKKIFDYLRVIDSCLLLNNTKKLHNYDELVDWLVTFRTNKYSQRQLADKIGVAYLTIANIERKATVMSLDTFLKITEIGDVEIKILNDN